MRKKVKQEQSTLQLEGAYGSRELRVDKQKISNPMGIHLPNPDGIGLGRGLIWFEREK